MRTFPFFACVAMSFLPLAVLSCSRLGEDGQQSSGRLCVSFDNTDGILTKSTSELPDTSDFILTVKSSSGSIIYEGKLGDCPESLEVPSGSYMVSAFSGTFTKPAFECPLFGDEQCVVIPAGGDVNVRLLCSQMNAGVSLDISKDFLTECPDAVLHLKSSSGRLLYSYSERRTAFFPPGQVSLTMNDDSGERQLTSRNLEPGDMLSIKVSVAEKKGGRISVVLDTARVWLNEECIIGGNVEEDVPEVLSVAQARNSAGMEDVWVSGYIVGGDLTSASCSFDYPFRSNTNLLLGPRSSTVDRNVCLAVQLPDGDVRRALNLVDNPEMLGRKVKIKGDLVSAYFAMPGIKNIVDYQLM